MHFIGDTYCKTNSAFEDVQPVASYTEAYSDSNESGLNSTKEIQESNIDNRGCGTCIGRCAETWPNRYHVSLLELLLYIHTLKHYIYICVYDFICIVFFDKMFLKNISILFVLCYGQFTTFASLNASCSCPLLRDRFIIITSDSMFE